MRKVLLMLLFVLALGGCITMTPEQKAKMDIIDKYKPPFLIASKDREQTIKRITKLMEHFGDTPIDFTGEYLLTTKKPISKSKVVTDVLFGYEFNLKPIKADTLEVEMKYTETNSISGYMAVNNLRIFWHYIKYGELESFLVKEITTSNPKQYLFNM